jgi:hypothetical protein
VSDATLRELERAAQGSRDPADWTRLALAQARAGQDGSRAAVRALLLDPAAPVRELLLPGVTPAPRTLAPPVPAVLRGAGAGRDPVDLGEGRVLVPSDGELVALDLFRGGDVMWRQPRIAMPLARPALVGERVVECGLEAPRGAALVVSRSALTGEPAGTIRLPPVVSRSLLLLGDVGVVVPLDPARCVAVVQGDGAAGLAFCDLERGQLLEAVPAVVGLAEVLRPRAAGGALAVGHEDGLSLREADGRTRWAKRPGEGALVLAARTDLLAVALGDPRTPTLVSTADGERLAPIPGASWQAATFGDALLVGAFERPDTHHLVVEGWEPGRAPARRWSVALGGAGASSIVDLRTAGDVLLLTWRSAGRMPMGAVEVTALELATGERLWSRVLDPGWRVGLAGGCLVEVGPTQGVLRAMIPVRRLAPGAP